MSRLPSEVPGAGGLRDQYGRKEYTYRALNAALAVDDVQGAGSVFDADGREQLVITSLPSSGGSSLAGYYDITAAPYNATTAAADNTTAIQAAINAAKASGGAVYVPPGVFKYASPLNWDNSNLGCSMIGAPSGMGHINVTPSELRYTGSGATPAISCHSVHGFGFDSIRFTYDNSAGNFTGDLIDVDGNPLAADCTNWWFHNCSSKGLGASLTARSIVRLNKAITGHFESCHWTGALNCLRMGDPGGSYVVGVQVNRCTFNNSTDTHHVLIGSGDAEAISFNGCVFEASVSTGAVRGARTALDGGNCVIYGFSLANCWFGDASAQTTWIQDLFSQGQGPIVIGPGNRFASVQSTSGIHLSGGGAWFIFGNHFENGNIFSHSIPGGSGSGSEVIMMFGNYFANIVAKVINGDASMQLSEWGNTATSGAPTALNTPNDAVGAGRFAIRNTTGATVTDSGDTTEKLVMAAATNAGFAPAGLNKSFVFDGKTPNPTGERGLILQGPWDGTHGHILFGVGSGPFPMIDMAGGASQAASALGFYNATPVVQAARAGQLTDSTGGTVTSTLAAGITDAVAKNAIASLAAKVNALETIIHNLGLSA